MSDRGTIVVVAPESDFRRSLSFALQAEGYHVIEFSGLAAAGGTLSKVQCSLVDAKIARDEASLWRSLGDIRRKIVLLTSRPRAFQRHGAGAELITPFSGTDLVTVLAKVPLPTT